MTPADKIALAALIVTIAFGIIAGGWALYTRPRQVRHSRSTTPTPVNADDDSTASSAIGVSWQIEPISGARYNLRNTGMSTALGVHVDKSRAPALNRGLPEGRTVIAHDAVQIMLKGSWQSPMPSSLYLRWEGQPEWVAVPIT